MSALTKEFLEDLGVNLEDQYYDMFSEHFDDTLYLRIEDDIIHSLSREQIQELGNLRGIGGDHVWLWLQANVSNLGEIVRVEVDKMLAEVVRNSDHI